MITQFQLKQICPNINSVDLWAHSLNESFLKYEFSPIDIAMFIAQCAHESGEFNILQENLNYSSDRLLVIFPKYFKADTVQKFHRRPQDIANTVYANRMGNGNFASGDGFKFRGRGIIMTTGRENYQKCSKFLYDDEKVLINKPDILLTQEGAVNSAIWFWVVNGLNKVSSDIISSTKKINGGKIGLEDREKYFIRAKKILGC